MYHAGFSMPSSVQAPFLECLIHCASWFFCARAAVERENGPCCDSKFTLIPAIPYWVTGWRQVDNPFFDDLSLMGWAWCHNVLYGGRSVAWLRTQMSDLGSWASGSPLPRRCAWQAAIITYAALLSCLPGILQVARNQYARFKLPAFSVSHRKCFPILWIVLIVQANWRAKTANPIFFLASLARFHRPSV